MSRQEKNETANTGLPLLSRALQLLAKSLPGMQFTGDASTPDHAARSRRDQAFSGGYNEAFVMQYWASYNPRQ